MVQDGYFRLCPTCEKENSPEVMRCVCGALLAGVDLTTKSAHPLPEGNPSTPLPTKIKANGQDAILCPYEDCAQPNPPDSIRCIYCDRALDQQGALPPELQSDLSPTLFRLPGALNERYQITRALPATGAEADLFVVSPLAGGEERIVKIYRHGIHPNHEIAKRIAQVDKKNRIDIIESAISDGFTYELMEFCKAGSLRDLLSSGPLQTKYLLMVIDELSRAITDVHRAGLIHRDLKPENILIRSVEPPDFILTDFGVASIHNATLRFTSVARTLAYSAPEALSGIISPKTDWWSLGLIILECILGKHPFSGLSDTVILLQLTTRPIDLAEVDEPNLKKLLRGLLQRNPESRWGFDEIHRWLSGDTSLLEPQDETLPESARYPYQIGADRCHTAEELAVALARNWDLAVSDLTNGLLIKWFRESLQDQNRVRFIINLNLERHLHVDVRLLRLILDLAPGIPPVWRGNSLGLREILERANLALKQDQAAILWLDALYEHRVLEAYAASGNIQARDIQNRWHSALSDFNSAWKTLAGELESAKPSGKTIPDVDGMLYGNSKFFSPSPRQMHAKLLAALYDQSWAARLKKFLQSEIERLSLSCPWLTCLGDISAWPVANLLALESLLPEINKLADKSAKAKQQREDESAGTFSKLKTELPLTIRQINTLAHNTLMTEEICSQLEAALEHFFSLCNQIRALGRTDASYQNLKNRTARMGPFANRLLSHVHELTERRAQNRALINQQTISLIFVALFFIPILFRRPIFIFFLVAALGSFLLWRYLPNYFIRNEIRALATKITRLL